MLGISIRLIRDSILVEFEFAEIKFPVRVNLYRGGELFWSAEAPANGNWCHGPSVPGLDLFIVDSDGVEIVHREWRDLLGESPFLKSSRIGILMMYDDLYEPLARITIDQSVRQYCDLHGYRLYEHKVLPGETDRATSWQKLPKSLEILESGEVDWLFYLDVDCLIMNPSIRLESLIDDEYSIILPAHGVPANDCPLPDNGFGGDGIIAAMYLMRRSEKAISFLREAWECRETPEGIDPESFDWEQRQFRLLISKPEYKGEVKIVEERSMNTFWYINNPFMVFSHPGITDLFWKPGDFIVHVTGYKPEERTRILADLSYFSGGAIRARMESDRVIFSPIVDLPYARVVLRGKDRKFISTFSFEELKSRANYWIALPEGQQEIIIEAYDISGKIIAQKIVSKKSIIT